MLEYLTQVTSICDQYCRYAPQMVIPVFIYVLAQISLTDLLFVVYLLHILHKELKFAYENISHKTA